MPPLRDPVQHARSVRMTALKIVGLYAGFSFAWLWGFDVFLDAIGWRDYETHSDALLVLISSVVFFVLLVRYLTRHDRAQRMSQERAMLADRAELVQKHNEDLRVLNAKLLDSNGELEKFAYVASHDLREPLRHVSAYVTLLDDSCRELDDEAREYIHFARQGAKRMDRLITDLLDYSRLNRKMVPFRPVALDGVLADVIVTLEPTIAQVAGDVGADGPLPEIMGDIGQLERLFLNLIGNALKYHAPDRPPRVRIAASSGDGMWRITVTDNGIGIPEDQRERIFGIFQRLHSQAEYEGTGIGLAVCRKIVANHGGSIEVQDNPGGGSVFVIRLPAMANTAE